MKNTNKLIASALLALATFAGSFAQTTYSCSGCPELDDRSVVNLSTLADANGNLVAGHTLLTCSNLYILDRKIYVSAGDTLTILPGVVVKAEFNASGQDANALIVTRGGKIFAEGSECCPIIFTSVEDPLDGTYPKYTNQRWGGVLILGYATNSVAAGELNPENPNFVTGGASNGLGNIEGIDAADPRHWYGAVGGAFDDDDNSGVMKYVSIRHGGSQLGDGNEINGLTLGSVGRGTTLDYIEIFSNYDDGVEFFGGTVNMKHLRVLYCRDDYADWDQGWNGNLQFFLGVQRPETTADGQVRGDNGMECDGDDGDDYPRLLLSNPTISNATIIGNDSIGNSAKGDDNALDLKERTKGKIYNSIFANFRDGLSYADANMDTVIIRNCTFVHMDRNVNGTFVPGYDPAQAGWNNTFVATLAGMTTDLWSTTWDAVPTSGGSTYNVNADDSWFETVSYRGAFQPGQEPWWNMSCCPGMVDARADSGENISSFIANAATDLNNDGVTNAADLGLLIGRYNKTNDEN